MRPSRRRKGRPGSARAAIMVVLALLGTAARPMAPRPAPAPAAGPAAAATMPGYTLGPGDKLRITVYDEQGLTGDYVVSARGTVSLPLAGEIPAAGETIDQFQAALTSRLAKGILNDPQVAAEIVEYRPFFILGEVNKPGQYPYSVGLTVYSAVATAQGFTYRANTRKVLIRHAGESSEHRVRIGAATPVMPGDTVRVLERFF
jgi:protein involved in polysaccharide export with SLBB domain